MPRTGKRPSKTKPKKMFTFEFVLEPGKKPYSRAISVDPNMRVIDILRRMIPPLARRYPDKFSKITATQLNKWKFYFGSIEEKEFMEKLEPRESLIDQGIFTGSTIAAGPESCFS